MIVHIYLHYVHWLQIRNCFLQAPLIKLFYELGSIFLLFSCEDFFIAEFDDLIFCIVIDEVDIFFRVFIDIFVDFTLSRFVNFWRLFLNSEVNVSFNQSPIQILFI